METDDLPQSVKDEVDKAKQEIADGEQGGPDAGADEEPQVERVKLSRRAQKEEERKAELQAANDRADEAKRMAEQIRQDSNERLARMEGMLQSSLQQPRYQQEPQRAAPAASTDEMVAQLRRDADKALASSGDLGEYHQKREAADALLRERDKEDLRRSMEQRVAQIAQSAAPQMPDWVRAVEAQYPDVIMHPAGKNAVAAFAQVEMAKTGKTLDPQQLMDAYTRAREELGLKARTESKVQERRQQLASGPSSSVRSSGGGSKDTFVNAPKNYREIAKRAGMKPEDYLKQYAAANPNDVSYE